MNKEDMRFAKWKRIKSKGRIRYLIRMGVFYYGLVLFFVFVFLGPFIDNNYKFKFLTTEIFRTRLIIFGIISPMLGLVQANVRWNGLERKYKYTIN